MLKIQELKSPPSLELFSELVELLQDAVNSGASIGWLSAPATREARNYWTGVLEAVGRGERRLFVATDDHVCAGAIQLRRPQTPSSLHRGEIVKLMVHSQYRKRGIGRALVAALERSAAADGLTLLLLHVNSGDPAESLCAGLGWKRVGEIPLYTRTANGGHASATIYYRTLPADSGASRDA